MFSLDLTERLRDRLEIYAKRERRPLGFVVRDAVEMFLLSQDSSQAGKGLPQCTHSDGESTAHISGTANSTTVKDFTE